MRMHIKKLLKKHKYPPEGMEDAVQTVMTQCELWTDMSWKYSIMNTYRQESYCYDIILIFLYQGDYLIWIKN